MALLQQEGGLIPELITKMEINLDHFKDNAIRHLERGPRCPEPDRFMWARI